MDKEGKSWEYLLSINRDRKSRNRLGWGVQEKMSSVLIINLPAEYPKGLTYIGFEPKAGKAIRVRNKSFESN